MSFEKLISHLKISFCSHNYSFYQELYIGAPTFFFRSTEKTPSKMGKAPAWLTKERGTVTLAWLHATNRRLLKRDPRALFKALFSVLEMLHLATTEI
jgi:acyl-coenzyme A synthetase/AMP-(fatty) acid ligase